MKLWSFISLLSGLLLSFAVAAEQKQQLGNWDVHYMLMPTTLLDAEVAKNYQLSRSRNYQLLNISVLNSKDQQAQQVELTGSATNLAGQRQQLTFKPVKEGAALYYLAGVEARSEQKMTIELTIRQGEQTQVLKFTQDVYPE
jgi:broad specificity polyphosphatase/5'/3'-nucleotidase SurE